MISSLKIKITYVSEYRLPRRCSDKESTCNAGQSMGQEGPWEEEMANPLQYSCLENPHGQSSLEATIHRGHKESDTTERLTHTHTHVSE